APASSSSSTISTSSRAPTGSSTSGPVPGTRAAASSSRGRRRSWWRRRARLRGSFCGGERKAQRKARTRAHHGGEARLAADLAGERADQPPPDALGRLLGVEADAIVLDDEPAPPVLAARQAHRQHARP